MGDSLNVVGAVTVRLSCGSEASTYTLLAALSSESFVPAASSEI